MAPAPPVQAWAADLELITSSPEANGFYGSKGLSGYVPLAYSLLEHRTWRRLNRRRGSSFSSGSGSGMPWLGPGPDGTPRGNSHHRHPFRWMGLRQRQDSPVGPRQLAWGGGWAQQQQQQQPWWRLGRAGRQGRQGHELEAEAAGEPPAAVGLPVAGGSSAAAAGEGAAGAGVAAGAGAGAGAGPARRLYEYCRGGWEFHAKGLWVSLAPPPSQQVQRTAQQAQQQYDGQVTALRSGSSSPSSAGGGAAAPAARSPAASASWAAPAVTLVGSSNFGFRSLHRDLEMQFVLVTRNAALRQVGKDGGRGRAAGVCAAPSSLCWSRATQRGATPAGQGPLAEAWVQVGVGVDWAALIVLFGLLVTRNAPQRQVGKPRCIVFVFTGLNWVG